MRELDLAGLQAFAAVARHRSFRRAAVEVGISASTLSQAVRQLEARLGLRLLNRTTRSVAPTEAGARLLDRLAPALAEIAQSVAALEDETGAPAGLLRINAPLPAIELVLAPMAAPFLAAHPRVRLEIVAETSLIDIVAAGFDAGVRWGEHLAQDMVAVPLGPAQRYAVVAAPALLDRVGAPSHPEALLGQPCIRQRFSSGRLPAWEFEKDGQELQLDPSGPLVATSIALQRQAALDGVGFWAIFEGYVEADIAAGRLVRVLEDWCAPFPGPFLYFPSRRQLPPPLRAFVDFVRAWRGGPG